MEKNKREDIEYKMAHLSKNGKKAKYRRLWKTLVEVACALGT